MKFKLPSYQLATLPILAVVVLALSLVITGCSQPVTPSSAPWTIDVPANQIVWFDPACHVDPSRSHAFPYRQRAWVEPRRDAGSDLGARDTLVLEYEPYDPAGATGAAERYYLGRGAGWYEWERSGVHDFFNRLGGPNTPMAREVWCAAP